MRLDCLRRCDALDGLRYLSDATIPLTLWSLSEHDAHEWNPDNFGAIADELWRVAMPGGIVAWMVRDADQHRAYFESRGFLYQTSSSRREGPQKSLALVFSKGRPRTVDLSTEGRRLDTWTTHPDPIEALAKEIILSWSRPGDLVLDPMAGVGATCKLALLNDRRYLGFVLDAESHRLAEGRMRAAHEEYRRSLDAWLGTSRRETPGITPPGCIRTPGAVGRLDDGLIGGTISAAGRLHPQDGYDVIYADPPWPFRAWGRNRKGRNVEDHYRTMPLEDILSLPVGDLAATDSVLFLWVTGPFLERAFEVAGAWGFQYRSIGFTWIKYTSGGVPRTGMGYHTRSNAEICIRASRGKGVPRVRKDVHSVVEAPVTRHSAKPAEVRRRIEDLYGDRRRMELFARVISPGWDALGDALDGRDIRSALNTRTTEEMDR